MKTWIKKLGTISFLLMVLMLSMASSCSKDESPEPNPKQEEPQYSEDESAAFNSAVATLQAFSQPEESSIVETLGLLSDFSK